MPGAGNEKLVAGDRVSDDAMVPDELQTFSGARFKMFSPLEIALNYLPQPYPAWLGCGGRPCIVVRSTS